MNRDGERRVYVQMAPDNVSQLHLLKAAGTVSETNGRRLPPEEYHLTLIHFGKPAEMLTALRRAAVIEEPAYETELDTYLANTAALVTDSQYALEPLGYDRFGPKHNVLVARYKAPADLREIHTLAYAELVRFIGACGIDNAADFAESDPNFQYAREFNPHFTLIKGHDGPDPTISVPPVSVKFMPLEY